MFICLWVGIGVLFFLFVLAQGVALFHAFAFKRIYQYLLFVSYVSGILWFTLVNRLGMQISSVRFHPFHVLRQMLNCWFGFQNIAPATCKAVFRNSKNLLDSAHASPVEDLLLNIISFIPLGFLLPYVWPKLNGWKTVLLGLLFSVAIETTQYLAHLGCCDVDDIINDTLGTCIGYGYFVLYKKIAAK